MDGLEIIYEDPRWQDLEPLALRSVTAALSHLTFAPEQHELAILACNDARIAALNADFREKPKPTNVLSWPAVDLSPGSPPETELGDIAIAYETCAQEAAEQGKAFQDHVTHLLVHATLHLLGYDHEIDVEAAQMERLEVEILGKLGVANPY